MERSAAPRQNGDNAPLEDYWKECNSFDDGVQNEEEEDYSKTPDEGEAEEEWLREAGFQKLVDSDPNDPAQSELFADILSTLTARQIAVVKRRLDTVQMSKKRRVPRSSRHRADVRELFMGRDSSSPLESLPTIASEPTSLGFTVDGENLSCSAPTGERWTHKSTTPNVRSNDEPFSFPQPHQHPKSNSRALPLTFLRTSHSGGFSLGENTRAIDCESPTSVEVLRYEIRKSTASDRDASDLSSTISDISSLSSSDQYSLETGFQEISSRINSLSSLADSEKDLTSLQRQSNVQVSALSETDRTLVRSLSIIEVAALLDAHGLVPTRRRKPNRKKNKDNVVFGASINALLELDRRRYPGLKIPLIYQWILHHLHSNGLQEEGLLRLAGSVQKIQVLKSEIERNYVNSPTVVENLIQNSSPIDISVLLKQLVRHLPEPLLTNSHMDAFLQVPNIPNLSDQINILNLLTLALSDGHRELLQELLHFLSKVVEDEGSNRMCLSNVAMIMAPNMFPPPRLKKGNAKNNDLATEVTIAAMSSKVTQLLIKYGSLLGTVPPELLAQARLQNCHTAAKIPKRGGRKHKPDKLKNPKDDNPSVTAIRVQVHTLRHPSSLVVPITDRTTAGDVVQSVADVLDHRVDPRKQVVTLNEQQENRAFLQRPRTTSEPIIMRQRCFIGSKKSEYLRNHFLYFIRENVGERRLDHGINILTISGSGSGRFASGSTWEVRCCH